MDSVIFSNSEETMKIWASEEQISDIVKCKVNGIIANVVLWEGECKYEISTEDLYLIH